MISNKKARLTLKQPGFWDRGFVGGYPYLQPLVLNNVVVVVDSSGYGYISILKRKSTKS